MMKKVLVVYFSQTGQLERILRSVLAPLSECADVEAKFVALSPVQPYPFPWPINRFFGQFPECVYLDPTELFPPNIDVNAHYDLIVLGYQPWFLSPSPPTTAFLKSEWATVLNGRPVITVIGARNMWLMGQEAIRELIMAKGGRFAGNIALIDQSPPASTFVTTPLWMLTGYRKGLGSWLPPAGIDDATISAARVHGDVLLAGLIDGRIGRGEPVLDPRHSAPVDPRYIVAERFGRRSFRLWGRLARWVGPQGSWRRTPILVFYAVFLIGAILSIVPITVLARRLLSLLPAYRRWMKRQVDYFQRAG